jgi:hypothetical protein
LVESTRTFPDSTRPRLVTGPGVTADWLWVYDITEVLHYRELDPPSPWFTTLVTFKGRNHA